jgi:hypothetical protein
MEVVIFKSPEKYKILEIKKLLTDNNIPVASVQLYIHVVMTKRGKGGNIFIIDEREDRGELIVPIEEFNEKLNDAQTFEIYIEEHYANEAIKLIEEYTEENYYKDCVFQSSNYDEAYNIQILLQKNNIPCGNVETNFLDDNTEEYLIFLNPEYKEIADNLIKNSYKNENEVEIRNNKHTADDDESDNFYQENKWGNIFRIYLKASLTVLIIFAIMYIINEKHPFFDRMFEKILELIKNNKQYFRKILTLYKNNANW